MAKNENHASMLFDSLNEAFWCTDYNTKNLSSLQSPIIQQSGVHQTVVQLSFFFFFPYFTSLVLLNTWSMSPAV